MHVAEGAAVQERGLVVLDDSYLPRLQAQRYDSVFRAGQCQQPERLVELRSDCSAGPCRPQGASSMPTKPPRCRVPGPRGQHRAGLLRSRPSAPRRSPNPCQARSCRPGGSPRRIRSRRGCRSRPERGSPCRRRRSKQTFAFKVTTTVRAERSASGAVRAKPTRVEQESEHRSFHAGRIGPASLWPIESCSRRPCPVGLELKTDRWAIAGQGQRRKTRWPSPESPTGPTRPASRRAPGVPVRSAERRRR